jgi:hypothetical protein
MKTSTPLSLILAAALVPLASGQALDPQLQRAAVPAAEVVVPPEPHYASAFQQTGAGRC